MNNIKIGNYIIIRYNGINDEGIAEIIAIDDHDISAKIILDEDNPDFIGDVFTMPIEDINRFGYNIASEEEVIKINKRLVFK